MTNDDTEEYKPVTAQGRAAIESMTITDEADAYGVITGCFTYINELVKFRAADIEIDPQSVLGRADASIPPYLASHHAQRAIFGATDHLFTLACAMGSDAGQTQTTYGPFTIIRGALESIGLGLYVLGKSDRREMLTRVLRLEASDDYNARKFGKYISSERRMSGRLANIQAATQKAGLDWSLINKHLGYQDIIRIGGESYHFADNLTVFWMLTSGVAHNKPWAVVSMTDRVEIADTRDNVGATYSLTSNTTHIAASLQTACVATEMLRNSYANKAQRRPDPKRILLTQAIMTMMQYTDPHRKPWDERIASSESAPNP